MFAVWGTSNRNGDMTPLKWMIDNNGTRPGSPHPQTVGLGWGMVWIALILVSLLANVPLLGQNRPEGVRFLATQLQAFGIPFKINSNEESFIEVQLYVSYDQGRTWRFADRQGTDQQEFRFQAKGDGEYWFGLKTLNRNRQLIPAGNVTPGLIVVVDTVPPEFDFQVSADAAGRVECRWRAADKNLNGESLKLEYQPLQSLTDTPADWREVPVKLGGSPKNGIYADRIAWWPETSERLLKIRGSIADLAGNRVEQERTITLAATPWRHRQENTARISQDLTGNVALPLVDPYSPGDQEASGARSTSLRPTHSQPTASESQVWASESERWTSPQHSHSSTVLGPTPNPENAPSLRNQLTGDETKRNTGFDPPPPFSQIPPANPPKNDSDDRHVISQSSTAGPLNQYQGPLSLVADGSPPGFTSGVLVTQPAEGDETNWGETNWVAEKTERLSLNPTSTPVKQSVIEPDVGNSTDASVQMIASKRFRLNYGIDAIDPSGVARVDLWMTRDDGRNWQSWGTDPDNTSPFPVEVEEEGRYGFRIVVHSRDGLTGRGPASGDKPDIVVHIDTQAPMVQIVSVPYGRGTEAGRLIINYRVADPHLTLRPISLFYSPAPDGPWLPIEEGVRNEGRYVWKPDGNVPDRIFLKLEAIDRAGNKGVHPLNQAIDVSGLVPRGTIHSVVPVAPR